MKKISIIFLLIFVFTLNSCWKKDEILPSKNYKTESVISWSINESKNYIGYIEWVEEVYLWAKLWWKIIWLYAEEWQRISAWNILWELDSEEQQIGINVANNITNSLENLSFSTAEMFDEQIKSLEQKVEQAKTSISIAESSILVAENWNLWSIENLNDIKNITNSQLDTIKSQIEQAKVWLETSQKNYNNTVDSLNQKESDIYSNSKIAVNQITNFSISVFDFLDIVLWITEKNKDKNKSYENFLWANKTETKLKTESLLLDFQDKLKSLKEQNSYIIWSNVSQEEIYTTLTWINNNLYPSVKELLQSSYDMFDQSIASVWSLSETDIINYKNQIHSFQNNLDNIVLSVSATTELWIKWAINNIENFKKNKKAELDLLKKQIELAEKNIETLEKTYKNYEAISLWQINDWKTRNIITEEQKSIAKKQKQITEQQLEELYASIKSIRKQKQAKLDELNTKKEEINGNKMTSIVYLDNTKIISSIDGIVTKKFWEIGQIVWPWMPIYIVSNDDKLKIRVSIPETSLKDIILWEEVKVTLEEQKKVVNWKISKILPTIDKITKSWNIEIEIENIDHTIKIWSYASVEFSNIESNSQKSEDWFLVPNSAIISDLWIPSVYVIVDNIAILKSIEIIESGEEKTQVRWLNIGDLVITEWKENISDWEKLK